MLLIEDDDPLRNALAGSLRRHGHSTIEARSAEEAEQYFDGGSGRAWCSSTSICPGTAAGTSFEDRSHRPPDVRPS